MDYDPDLVKLICYAFETDTKFIVGRPACVQIVIVLCVTFGLVLSPLLLQ